MDFFQIEDIVKNELIKHLNLDKDYFTRYSDNGNNLYLTNDLGCDLLDRYEILNAIEKKCGILIPDDDIIWNNDLTIYQYVDSILKNIQSNKYEY